MRVRECVLGPLTLEVSADRLMAWGAPTIRQALADLIDLVLWRAGLRDRDLRPIGAATASLRFRLTDRHGETVATFGGLAISGKLGGRPGEMSSFEWRLPEGEGHLSQRLEG